MKKNLFIFFCFVIPIIFFGNIGEAKASTTCTFKMEGLETVASSGIYTQEYYTIDIDMDLRILTFTNVYYDENIKSDSNDYSVKRGEKRTFTFDEILEHDEGFTILSRGDGFEFNFRAIARNAENYTGCDSILYEQLKGTNIYRFRYRTPVEMICGDQIFDNSYGPTTCLDNGVDPLNKYTCSPSVGTNSYTKIKYSFSTDEKKMVIEFPNSIKQVLDLESIELPDEQTLEVWKALGVEFDSNQIANLGGMYAIFDASDCTSCFDDFHTTSSGRVTFGEYVQISIDKELSDILFSNTSNSCPTKIYAKLTFQEWGDTFKPQYSPIDNGFSSTITAVINSYKFFEYLNELSSYNYSDYNFATIELTTKDCGNECFSITTSDTLVIIDKTKSNLDLGEIENCQYLEADEFYGWLRGLLKVIRIGAIILVVILTGLDALKSFVSFDEKNSKNFYKHLLNRLMCIAILFLAPSVIELFISLFNANDVISKVSAEPFCGLLKK